MQRQALIRPVCRVRDLCLQPFPSPIPGATADQSSSPQDQGLPANAYPLRDDPAATTQHPGQALKGRQCVIRATPPHSTHSHTHLCSILWLPLGWDEVTLVYPSLRATNSA